MRIKKYVVKGRPDTTREAALRVGVKPKDVDKLVKEVKEILKNTRVKVTSAKQHIENIAKIRRKEANNKARMAERKLICKWLHEQVLIWHASASEAENTRDES